MRWEIGEYIVHQLLCGRDVAADGSNPLFVAAGQMANYIYLVEHVSAPKEALLVDAAWDVEGVYSYAESYGLNIVGAIYTHYHFDHIGGPLPKSMTRGKDVSLEGIATVLEHETPIYGSKEAKNGKRCFLRFSAILNFRSKQVLLFNRSAHSAGPI